MMASQLCSRVLGRWALPLNSSHRQSLSQLSLHTSCSSNTSINQHHPNRIAPINHILTRINKPSTKQSQKQVDELQQRLEKLSVSPALPSGLYVAPQSNIEYKLPSYVGDKLKERIIVDPALGHAVIKCPTIVPDKEIDDPRKIDKIIETPPGRIQPEKHAKIKNIILIRRKKMKKHKLKKLKKRMQFQTYIILQRRKKKKRLAWEARLETYKFKELTDEIIEEHMAKLREKRDYLEGYFRAQAGLETRSNIQPKKKRMPVSYGPPPPMTPTPILPPEALRR